MAFHDRKHELALLDDLYARPGGQLFVLYGRRRIGKTALLTHWLESRQHASLFWTADQMSTRDLIRQFSAAIQVYLNPGQAVPADFTYGTWELALNEVARLAEERRLVVILDEFTYLIAADPSLPSVLQRLWDHRLKKSNLLLVLTGSHAGMIQREVLAYRAPLYNRATGSLHLQPLPFGALAQFLPGYSLSDRAGLYACLGGVPQYLELVDGGQSLNDNLRRLLSSSMIIDDARALLRDQLDEPRNYISIVSAIAAGYTRLTEIATMSGLEPSNASKYLDMLQQLGIVERHVPATISRPEHSKQGRYRVIDHYLRFYYRFLAVERTNLERGLIQQAWLNIQQHLSEFVGLHIFEELCREWVQRSGDAGRLAFAPRRVGSFWGTRLPQIDVVAVNEDAHRILLGECKWTAAPISQGVVKDFFRRADQIIPAPAEAWQVTYAFFSLNAFTDDAIRAGTGRDCLWIKGPQIDADLRDV